MSSASITLATAMLLAGQLVEVHSSTSCPSSPDIAERLRPLLPAGPAQTASPDLATVEVVGATEAALRLRIHLARGTGTEVGDRQVLVPADCAEAAATAAAVIAAWESQPLTSPPPRAAVPAASQATAGTATSSSWRLLVGARGGVGLVGGVAAAGGIEVLAGKMSSRLRGRIGFAGEALRSRSLPPGSVEWRHTTFDVGVVLRTLHPLWSLSVDSGLAVGWATLTGRGFSEDHRQRSLEYGAMAGVRLGRNLGSWCAWAEARLYGWVQGQRASRSGETTASVDLPLVDAIASIGVSAPLLW
jgi:hypothetical protein